jgi:hypothetical protein
MLTARQIAEQTGFPVKSVYAVIYEQKIPYIKVDRQAYRNKTCKRCGADFRVKSACRRRTHCFECIPEDRNKPKPKEKKPEPISRHKIASSSSLA